MRSNGINTVVGLGTVAALVLFVAAVWAADVSTATSLASTGLLVLLASTALAIVSARPGGPQPNQADATAQRERMRQLVP